MPTRRVPRTFRPGVDGLDRRVLPDASNPAVLVAPPAPPPPGDGEPPEPPSLPPTGPVGPA